MKLDDVLNEGPVELSMPMAQKALQFVHAWAEDRMDFDALPPFAKDLMMDAFRDEMPIGVQKGRSGTPEDWFYDKDPDDVYAEFKTWVENAMKSGHTVHQ